MEDAHRDHGGKDNVHKLTLFGCHKVSVAVAGVVCRKPTTS